MVTVEVRGPQSTVNGPLPEDLQQQLYLECSFEHARAIWRPDTLSAWDDGRIGVYYPRSGRIPTGCIPRLEHALNQWQIPYTVDRPLPAPNHQFPRPEGYDDRPYQGRMLSAALSAPYCTIQAPARSGKTFVAACYLICRQRVPAMFLVNTVDLCYQAQDELGQWLGQHVGLVGDGVYDPAEVTVASIQTLHPSLIRCGLAKPVKAKWDPTYTPEQPVEKHKELVELLQSAVVRVVDEVHMAAATTHQDVHRAMGSCAFSLGMSATPWVEGNNGIYLEASCGPVLIHITYSELIDEGKLVEPFIDIVRMPLQRFPSSVPYQTIYKQCIVQGQERNQIIANWVRRQAADGHSVIVFVNQKNHGLDLAQRCNATFVHGAVTGGSRKEIWAALRAKELPIVVSTVGKYGLDIPTLDACVMGGGGVATAPVLQMMTRVLTAARGKDHAHVLDFEDHARHLTDHARQRIGLYATERRFNIQMMEATDLL